MELHLTPDIEAKLHALVAETGRAVDEFVQDGPPAAITGFFTVRRVPRIMLWTVFAIFFSKNN